MSSQSESGGRISRREFAIQSASFMLGLSAAGLSTAGTSSALAQAASPAGQAKPTAAAEPPVSGGILTINFPSDPPNLDPISNSTGRVLSIAAACYSSLIMFDPLDPKKLIGDLAEKWDISEDGSVITFALIRNAKFHDGKTVTSADIKFTFDRVRNPPEGQTSPRRTAFDDVDRIETPDDFTVRFVLSRPSPSFLNSLAGGWMVIVPKHFVEAGGDLKTAVMGSGPFKLKSVQHGVSYELEKNPDYYVPGRPYLDGIKFFVVPDLSTTFAYFRSGNLQVYENIPIPDAKRVETELKDRAVILSGPALGFDSIMLNTTQKPFDDIRVRQAVNLAIDRGEAMKLVRSGNAYPGGFNFPDGPFAFPQAELEKLPGLGSFAPSNLDRAKQLLLEAGYPNGIDVPLLSRRSGVNETLALFVQDQLGKVGIRVSLDQQDDAVAIDNLNNKNFFLATWAHGLSSEDPDIIFGDFFISDGPRNYPGVKNPKVDELYAQQGRTYAMAERVKLVHDMERLVHADLSHVLLYWRKRFMGLSTQVRDYVQHPSMDNNRKMAGVWLTKA